MHRSMIIFHSNCIQNLVSQKLIWGILFFLSFSYLLGETQSHNYKYGDQNVTWQSDSIDEKKLTFRDKAGNIQRKFNFEYENFQSFGEYKPTNSSYLYLVTHSGGESGGSFIVRFFYPEPKKIIYYQIEFSGYGKFQVVDMDADGLEEYTIQSEKFYGLKLVDKDWGECEITPSLYLTGFSEYNLPEYYILREEENGKLKKVNITYTQEFRKYLKPYIQKIENRLSRDSGKTYIGGNDYFQDVFQYYFYMKQVGKKKEGLKTIRKSNITVEMYCSKSKDKIHAKLDKLVYKYFERNN